MLDDNLRKAMELAYEKGDFAEALQLSTELDKQILHIIKEYMRRKAVEKDGEDCGTASKGL